MTLHLTRRRWLRVDADTASPPVPVPHPQLKYGQLMHGLQQENVQINRKVLSELAMYEPYSFKALVDQVKFMRGL